MSRSLVFAIPGDLAQATGGYGYDRRIMAELETLGRHVEHLALPPGFPAPGADGIADSERLLARIDDGAIVLVDGLAFGAAPDLFARHAKRLRFVALVHHPLFRETGLDRAASERLFASEKRALELARAVIVTSAETGRTLAADFGLDPAIVTVAPPGTDIATRAKADGEPPLILSIGTLVPRKGHDVLVRALKAVEDLAWHCRIVGDGARDLDHAAALRDLVQREHLSDRVILAGERRDVEAEFADADLFVLATRYEGYGMVFAEALAHGLPIVGTQAGAVPDVVPETAGILVPADDVEALAGALRALLADPAQRARLAEGAWEAAKDLPRWEDTARIIAAVLGRVDP